MKIRFLKFKNWLLAGLGSLLGLNLGCTRTSDFECMYGVPEAEYEVKGRVTNPAGNPVDSIEVSMEASTTTTGPDGMYNVVARTFPNSRVEVNFRDTRPDLTAKYADTTVAVSFEGAEHEGGSDWYAGRASKTLDVTLKQR